MLISNSTIRALDEVAARERDLLNAYTPGAIPERSDSARKAAPAFTLDPLCVAPSDDAYFIVEEGGRRLFTRDGSFTLRDGQLVDASGRAVLGYAGQSTVLAPLRADAVDAELGLVKQASVAADGGVLYDRTTVDPRTGRRAMNPVRIGTIAMARFAPGTRLQVVDAQHAAAPSGIAPYVGVPGNERFGTLTPHARSASGIDIDAGLQRLQEAYLELDAIRASDKAQGNVEKTTMDLLK